MRAILIRWLSLVATVLLMSACTTTPPSQKPISVEPWYQGTQRFIEPLKTVAAMNNWQYTAKVGIVTPRVKEQANLVWEFTDQANMVRLFGPLGAGAIRLEFDQYGVVLSDNKGVLHRGRSAEDLLTRIVGWPIPLDALTYWVFALPNPDFAARYQLNDHGQISVLEQQGWTIHYQSYRDYPDASRLPRRIVARKELAGEVVEVKLITKQWQW